MSKRNHNPEHQSRFNKHLKKIKKRKKAGKPKTHNDFDNEFKEWKK